MAVLPLYLLLGSAFAVFVTAQNNTVYTLDRPLSKSRTEKAQLLDKLYSHRAIQDRLSPSIDGNRVNISVDMVIKKVSGVDELAQIIDSFVHFLVTWHDPDLLWNPQEYGGLETVQLLKERIWYPILYVINAGDSESFLVDADQVVSLWYNGTAVYHATKFLKSTCNLNLEMYPMDVQDCRINVVPSVVTPEAWIEHGRVLEHEEGQFDVKGAWKVIHKHMEVGSTSKYSFINVHLQLKRQSLFYIVCLLLPMFATSLLTVFVFWIPPKAGEKVSFLVSIVLANTVILNLLGDIIPRSIEKMPKCLLFIVGVIVQNFLAFVCTLIVIRKHEHEQNKEVSCVCRTDCLLKTHLNLYEPCSNSYSITSRNTHHSTDKNCQRSLRKTSNIVSPVLAEATADVYKRQSLPGDCFPFPSARCFEFRSRLKAWLTKVISVPASTLDKIFFIVFILLYVILPAIIMC